MGAPMNITVNQLQSGAREAVAELFHQNRPRLLALATRMVSASEAEDVVQDAFVSTLRHHGQFRGQSQPSTWIYRVTFNAALMRLRTRRRKGADSLDALPVDVAEASMARSAPAPLDPAAGAEREQTRGAIEDAMRILRPVDRQIVKMRFVEGLSTEEVAEATGLSVAATKTRLHRARAALREVLNADARIPAMA